MKVPVMFDFIKIVSARGLRARRLLLMVGLVVVFFFRIATVWGGTGLDTLRLSRVLQARALYATADQLENLYLVTLSNAVEKFDSTGRKVAVYTNRRLGTATFLDVTNPLKVLVWYPDFQTLVFLDRTLTEMGRLNFAQLGYISVRSVAVAADGNLWMYDDAQARAFKMTPEGVVLYESQALNIVFPNGFSAGRIRDNGQAVCLSDPQSGLCTLDQYANVLSASPFVKFADFDLSGEWLIFQQDRFLYLKNSEVQQTLSMLLPGHVPESGGRWVSRYGLLVQVEGNLEVFRWY